MIDYPLISIAMATYNGEKYLKRQIDSIYSQTYKNIEVIVTDDCSTDETVKILEQYAKTRGLKYYINEENLGYVKNFEKAVSLCQGEYIALSDQDDIWLPQKLSTLIENIGTSVLACSDAKLIDEKNNLIAESQFEYAKKQKNEKFTFSKLLIRNYIQGCTVLMKKEILQKAHPIPLEGVAHDHWYGLIASTLGDIYFCNEPLILYRLHRDNVCGISKTVDRSIFHKILLLVNKEHLRKRVIVGKQKAEILKRFKHTNRFSYFENHVLDDLVTYYKSWGEGFIHLKAFFVALKYKDDIFWNIPKKFRLFACFKSLFI